MEAFQYHMPWKLVKNQIRNKGGREIDRFRGIYPGKDFDNGSEAWIGSTVHVSNATEENPYWGCSEVILPTGEKKYLFEVIHEAPEEILGKKHLKKNKESMGLLVKFLDAQFQYDLQCHPTRSYAKEKWNTPYGKEESWYVVSVREDTKEKPYILLGFKEGVTRESFEKYYFADDMEGLESLCHKIEVTPGEVYYLGAGVPHALGAGCFVIEVQEPNDITVGAEGFKDSIPRHRIGITTKEEYDERLLGAFIYDGRNEEENLKRYRSEKKNLREGSWGDEKILIGMDQTSFFSFTELNVHGETEIINTGYPKIGIVMEGEGVLKYKNGEMKIRKADELFFPYDVTELTVEGNLKMVLCNPEGVEIR